MYIRKSTLADLPRIMDIYEGAREFMKETGNPNQWGPTKWPPESVIVNDINVGKSYVCVGDIDDKSDIVVGTFFMNYGHDIDSTYRKIEGTWIGPEEYGVVHRIAVSHDVPVKGVGTFCINWAFEKTGHLRIDTHTDNLIMQKLLCKLGFTECGIIHVEQDNYPRIAYEKM